MPIPDPGFKTLTNHASGMFHVIIGSDPLGDFQSVTGLEYSVDEFEYQEMGRNFSPVRLPFNAPGKIGDVTLKWGMIIRSKLYRWMEQVDPENFKDAEWVGSVSMKDMAAGFLGAVTGAEKTFLRKVTIIQMSKLRLPLRIYVLYNCWPKTWRVSDFENVSQMATEELVLCCDAIRMFNLSAVAVGAQLAMNLLYSGLRSEPSYSQLTLEGGGRNLGAGNTREGTYTKHRATLDYESGGLGSESQELADLEALRQLWSTDEEDYAALAQRDHVSPEYDPDAPENPEHDPTSLESSSSGNDSSHAAESGSMGTTTASHEAEGTGMHTDGERLGGATEPRPEPEGQAPEGTIWDPLGGEYVPIPNWDRAYDPATKEAMRRAAAERMQAILEQSHGSSDYVADGGGMKTGKGGDYSADGGGMHGAGERLGMGDQSSASGGADPKLAAWEAMDNDYEGLLAIWDGAGGNRNEYVAVPGWWGGPAPARSVYEAVAKATDGDDDEESR